MQAVTDTNGAADTAMSPAWNQELKLMECLFLHGWWLAPCLTAFVAPTKSLKSFSVFDSKCMLLFYEATSPASVKQAASLQVSLLFLHEASFRCIQILEINRLHCFLYKYGQIKHPFRSILWQTIWADAQTAKFGQLLFRQLRQAAQFSTPTGSSWEFHHLCWEFKAQ